MISGSNWSTILQGFLAGKGFNGSRMSDVTDAVGNGGQTHVVGKSFTTVDSGSTPGVGVGTGTGITGLSGAAISTLIIALATGSFGQAGAKLPDFADAVGDACVSELGAALLTSAHTPVFAGSGTVDVGSIPVVPAGWGSDINSAGSSLVGSEWSNFADAMGQGQANHVLAAGSGSVSISGSATGPVVPGAGTGTGTIS